MMFTTIKLGAIVKEYGGVIQTGPFGSQLHQSDYRESGTPVIMPKDIIDDRIKTESIARIDDVMVNKLSRHVLQEGDIVYPRRGDLNKRAYITKTEAGWLCGTGCMKISVQDTPVYPKYLFYFLKRPDVVQYIENKAIGATMPNLSSSVLADIDISYPTFEQQKVMASFLSAYDDLIENNTRRIALLEESMRLLYQEWFVRLRFPGHELVKVVDGVPERWEWKPLEQICDLTMGQSPPSDAYNQIGDGLPFHQGVTRFGDRFVSHDTYCNQPNRVAEAGDILFSVRAPVGRINVTQDKIAIGRGLSAMRSKRGFQSFFYYQLKNHFFKEDMLGSGAIFASVTKKQLSNELLLEPDYRIIKEFEMISRPVDQQVANLHRQNLRLTEARDLLLPRLMSGGILV